MVRARKVAAAADKKTKPVMRHEALGLRGDCGDCGGEREREGGGRGEGGREGRERGKGGREGREGRRGGGLADEVG